VRDEEPDYRRGLDDYHDPTAGFGGAPPARSALTLRLILAAFGLVFCGAAAVVLAVAGAPVFAVLLAILALVALVDLVVIIGRKRRGEPG
jgi:hypothetical protein